MGFTGQVSLPGTSAPTGVRPVLPRPPGVQATVPPTSQFGKIDLGAHAMNAIKIGAQAPGYIYDRPLAALNVMTGGGKGNKGLIDQAGDTIRGIPVLGDILSGGAQAVGNTIEGAGRLFPALNNSLMATALTNYHGRPDTDKVDGLAAWLSGIGGIMGDVTVGELRQRAAARGFQPGDVDDIRSGRRSPLDYADYGISDNTLVDLAGRMVVDPLNLLAVGGVGKLAKAATAIPGVTGLASMTRIDRLATGMNAINRAVDFSRPAHGTVKGMAALRAGEITGVTLGTFARHMAMVSRGSSDFLRAYRRTAIAVTGAQLGANVLDESGITDNTPLSPLLEPVYEAARTLGEEKPLSEGMLFNLWAAVNFPVRSGLQEAWTATKTHGLGIGVGRATIRTPLLRQLSDIEKHVIREMAPTKNIADGRRELIQKFGSEDRWLAFLAHHSRSLYVEQHLPTHALESMVGDVTTLTQHHAHGELVTRVADLGSKAAVETRAIDGRAVMQHIRDRSTGVRSSTRDKITGEVTDTVGRVQREFDPDFAIRDFNRYADTMESLNLAAGFQRGGNIVAGVLDGLMPKEHLLAAKATLRAIADPDGTIPKARMDEFLRSFPAITSDVMDPSNFFARLDSPDSGTVNVKAAIQRIDRMLEDERVITMREYLWDVEQWERRAASIRTKRGSVFNERGEIDPSRAPEVGNAAVMADTLSAQVAQRLGLGGDTYEQVLQSRGRADVRAREDGLAIGLDESGWNVRSASQGVMSTDGQKRTAVAVTLDSTTDPGALELAAAITARETQAPYAIAAYTGREAIAQHGLTPNAGYFRFNIGKASADEANAILDAVGGSFDGQFQWHDTSGTLHVYVKPGQEAAAQALQRDLASVVGDARMRVQSDVAWFRVVKNDLRGRRGRTEPADGYTASARDVIEQSAGDLRLTNADRKFSQRGIRYAQSRTGFSAERLESRGVLGEDRPGFVRPAATGDGLVGDGPGVAPESLDTLLDSMGVNENVPSRTGRAADGSPVVWDQAPGLANPARANERPPQYLYRAVSEEDWQQMQAAGFMQSDGRGNLGANEGTVAELGDPRAYLPPGEGRVLRIRYDASDGWRLDADGYVKTNQPVPIDRIDMASPKIVSRSDASGSITREVGRPGIPDGFEARQTQALADIEAANREVAETGAFGTSREASRVRLDENGQPPTDYAGYLRNKIRYLEQQKDAHRRSAHIGAGAGARGLKDDLARMDEEIAQAKADLDYLTGAGDPPSPFVQAHDTGGTQGQVIFLAEADDALAHLTPRLGGFDKASAGEMGSYLGGLAPEQLAKVGAMEAALRQYDPQYRLKIAPKGSPTYYAGQGDTIKDLVVASRATSDFLYKAVWHRAAQFQNMLFGRVYNKRLGQESKQQLYRIMLQRTANLAPDKTIRIKDIDSFLQTLNAAVREAPGVANMQLYARGDLAPPKLIKRVATGEYGRAVGGETVFQGFTKEALEALGGAENMHKLLDVAASRFWRDMAAKHRDSGSRLGNAITDIYGAGRVATARPRQYIRTWYHLFRFTLDPRFHIMNHLEADTLGLVKYGSTATRFRGARKDEAIDRAVMAHSGGRSADARLEDALASGYLDSRHLEGYIGRAFRKDRVTSTREVLRTMAQEDPGILALRRQFGGDEDAWIDGLEKMMYDFDTKGVRQTIEDEMKAAFIDAQDIKDMQPLMQRLYAKNKRIYEDVVHTFHGNVNRSNMERILNSYFLFWPISYQLKASKVLFDVLTKQSFGRRTNMGGTWYIDHLYREHVERLANDEEYQRMFVDNPALWQTAAMLLPITPMDIGVSFSRASRYTLAAAGLVDDTRFNEDPFMSAVGLFAIGPAYTIELARRLARESRDNPRDLVVPVN